MTLQSDHKALLFVGAIALLGGGVRLARATRPTNELQPALEHQMQAADSARQASAAHKRSRKAGARTRSGEATAPVPGQEVAPTERSVARGKLDVDIATVAQLDSLPGVGPTLAKRIVLDRMAHGPFGRLAALRRVKGVSAKQLQRLDTLVTFSGTIRSADPNDTLPSRVSSGEGRRSSRARGPRHVTRAPP